MAQLKGGTSIAGYKAWHYGDLRIQANGADVTHLTPVTFTQDTVGTNLDLSGVLGVGSDASIGGKLATTGHIAINVTQGGVGAVGGTLGGRPAAIALGDSDTGIAQNGDGVLELHSNNQVRVTMNTIAFNVSNANTQLQEHGSRVWTAATLDPTDYILSSDLLVGGTTINTSYLPPIAITDVFPVASQAAMLALTAQRGDMAIRSDVNKTFVLSTDDPTSLANWLEIDTPTDGVTNVNGYTTSTVTLDYGDFAGQSNPVLAFNYAYHGSLNGGAQRHLIGIDSSSKIQVGDVQQDMTIHAGNVPRWWNNTVAVDLMHTGGGQTIGGNTGITGNVTIGTGRVRIAPGDTVAPSNGGSKVYAVIENTNPAENLAFRMRGDDASDRMSFMTDYGSTGTFDENLTILASNGFVGVNDTDPSYRLSVGGVAQATTVYAGAGPIAASAAALQVNGFMRTGSILLHEGQTPSSSYGDLDNVGGVLKWEGNDVITNAGDQAIEGPLEIWGDLTLTSDRKVKQYAKSFNINSYLDAGEYLEIATVAPNGNSSNYLFSGEVVASISDDNTILKFYWGIRSNTLPSINTYLVVNRQMNRVNGLSLVTWYDSTNGVIKLAIKKASGSSVHNVSVKMDLHSRGAYTGSVDMSNDSEIYAIPDGFVETDANIDSTPWTSSNLDPDSLLDGLDVSVNGTDVGSFTQLDLSTNFTASDSGSGVVGIGINPSEHIAFNDNYGLTFSEGDISLYGDSSNYLQLKFNNDISNSNKGLYLNWVDVDQTFSISKGGAKGAFFDADPMYLYAAEANDQYTWFQPSASDAVQYNWGIRHATVYINDAAPESALYDSQSSTGLQKPFIDTEGRLVRAKHLVSGKPVLVSDTNHSTQVTVHRTNRHADSRLHGVDSVIRQMACVVQHTDGYMYGTGETQYGYNKVFRSTDGVSWTEVFEGSAISAWHIASNGTTIVVAGNYNNTIYVAYSTDGTTWTENQLLTDGYGYPRLAATDGGDVYLMYTQLTTDAVFVLKSSDGSTWTDTGLVATSTYAWEFMLAANDGGAMAVYADGDIVFNFYDGSSWSGSKAPTMGSASVGNLGRPIGFGNKFVISGPGTANTSSGHSLYHTSDSGTTWSEMQLPFWRTCGDLGYTADGTIVTTDEEGAVAVSTTDLSSYKLWSCAVEKMDAWYGCIGRGTTLPLYFMASGNSGLKVYEICNKFESFFDGEKVAKPSVSSITDLGTALASLGLIDDNSGGLPDISVGSEGQINLLSNYLIFQDAGATNRDYIAYNDTTNSFYFNSDTSLTNTSANAPVYGRQFQGLGSASGELIGVGGYSNNYGATDLRINSGYSTLYIDTDQLSSGFAIRKHASTTGFATIFDVDTSGNVTSSGGLTAGGPVSVTGAISATGNATVNSVILANLEKNNLTTDGQLGFDSSQGLLVYRTQQGVTGATTVLDGANVGAGTGISITNIGAGGTGTEEFTFSATGDLGTQNLTFGSTITGTNFEVSAYDLKFGFENQSARGDSGSSRALVKQSGALHVNYAADFGDTIIDSDTIVDGDLEVQGTITSGSVYITGSAGVLTLGETDNTNVWYLVADGNAFSLRQNNTGTYPIKVGNDGVLQTHNNQVIHAGGGQVIGGNLTLSSDSPSLYFVEGDQASTSDNHRIVASGGALWVQSEGEIRLTGYNGADVAAPPTIRSGGSYNEILHSGGGQTVPDITVTNMIHLGPGTSSNDNGYIEWLGTSNAGYMRISTADDNGTEHIEFGDYDVNGPSGAFTEWLRMDRSTLKMGSQNYGISFSYSNNASTPTGDTSGCSITGGADYAGLTKRNNIDVQTWFGFSVSPTYGSGSVAQNTPAFSVNAREGHVFVAGDVYSYGTSYYGNGKSIVNHGDGWLRLNPSNDFASGIYTGTGLVRIDGRLQIGSGSTSSLNVDSSGNFTYQGNEIYHAGNKPSASDVGAAPVGTTSPGSNYLYVMRNSTSSPFYVNQRGTGDLARIFAGSSDSATTGTGVVIQNDGTIVADGGVSVGGTLTLASNKYNGYAGTYAMDMSNSDVIGANTIYFADKSDAVNEGLAFPRDTGSGVTAYSYLKAFSDGLYFVPDGSTNREVIHEGNISTIFGNGGHMGISQLNANVMFGSTGKFYTNDGGGNMGIRFGGAWDHTQTAEDGCNWRINVANDSATGGFGIDYSNNHTAAGETVSYVTGISISGSDGRVTFGGEFTVNSDAKLKDNLRRDPYTPAELRDKLVRIDWLLYDRTDTGAKDDFGVIAQEIQEVLPEVVQENHMTGNLTVNYERIHRYWAVVNAWQEERLKRIEEFLALD